MRVNIFCTIISTILFLCLLIHEAESAKRKIPKIKFPKNRDNNNYTNNNDTSIAIQYHPHVHFLYGGLAMAVYQYI